MGMFSHVRLRFWDDQRYTEAQALEFRKLRALYLQYLAPVLGQEFPSVLRLRADGDEFYPAYTEARSQTAVMGRGEPTAQPLKPFANGLIARLRVYEERRQQRVFRKGHTNDPAHLLLIYLNNTFHEWLATAPSDEATLKRVVALREFLEAIRREAVFSQEPEGHGSMRVLLHNLIRPLALLEDHLIYEISLHSAREHFNTLKASLNEALDQSLQYLFYSVSEKPRTTLAFSLLSASSDVVDEKLQASLKTREGALLKNLIQHPRLVGALFPQGTVQVKSFGKPLSLMGETDPTPFVDEAGEASSLWLDFLKKTPALEVQLDPELKKLPLGICPLITPKSSILDSFVRLHGLIVTLAQFQDYLQQCWQLAGFGGDQLIYDRLAEAITSLLLEFRGFSESLQGMLGDFQKQLDSLDTQALSSTSQRGWQANYEHAKACQEKLLKMLTDCDRTVDKIISYAKDTSARCRRFEAALEACQRLQGAKDFLNQARRQIGLEPKPVYPGLETQGEAKSTLSDAALPRGQITDVDQVLLVLTPNTPQQVATLSQICTQTPRTAPYSLFRGTHRRYCYLHDSKRLLKMGEDFTRLQHYPQRAISNEGKPIVDNLRKQMKMELTSIDRLSAGLCWPFHRASQRFFATWQQVFKEGLEQLDRIDVAREEAQQAQKSASLEAKRQFMLGSVVMDAKESTGEGGEEDQDSKTILKEAKDSLSQAKQLLADTLREKAEMLRARELDPVIPTAPLLIRRSGAVSQEGGVHTNPAHSLS